MAPLLSLLALLLPHPALAAEDCVVSCQRLPTRMAQLRCQLGCEQRDPAKYLRYCKEFTPCLIACEAKHPREAALTQAQKDEGTRCTGPCFTSYFKLECQNANWRDPGDSPGGSGGPKAGGEGGNGGLALADDSGLSDGRKTNAAAGAGKGNPAAAAAHPGGEGVVRAIGNAEAATKATLAQAAKAEAPSGIAAEIPDHRKDPAKEAAAKPGEEHLWNLLGGLKRQSFDKNEEGEAGSALAEVVKASIDETAELTLFERVSRAYRNTPCWFESR